MPIWLSSSPSSGPCRRMSWRTPQRGRTRLRRCLSPHCRHRGRHVRPVRDDSGLGLWRCQCAGWSTSPARRASQPWPVAPQVPSVVLAEALTSDHRRDFHANRLLRACQIRAVDELHAREAARLRTATGRASKISATDAIVAAFASFYTAPVVLTSDPRDLTALVGHAARPVKIARA